MVLKLASLQIRRFSGGLGMRSFALTICVGLIAAGTAGAAEGPQLMFDLGVGFTTPVEAAGNFLDTGANIQGGVGANFASWFGTKLQLDYNSMGFNRNSFYYVGAYRGDVDIFSATVDPIIYLNPHGHVVPYLIGGGGVYYQQENFHGPGCLLSYYGCYLSPFGQGRFLGSYSVTKPGINAGVGFEFGPKRRGKIFAEARWTRIFLTSSFHMDYVPVVFGFRW
jgi:Outer membrane protein beta-barrel domain